MRSFGVQSGRLMTRTAAALVADMSKDAREAQETLTSAEAHRAATQHDALLHARVLTSPHTPPARSSTRDIQHFGHRPRQGHLHLHLIIPCPETLPLLHSQETLSVVVELCENVRVPHALLPQRVTERAGRAP